MPKRSGKRDFSQVAFDIVQEATQEPDVEEAPTPAATQDEAALRAVMAEMGRRGGKKGGKARAEKLTPEERSEIARKAAQARWGKKGNR